MPFFLRLEASFKAAPNVELRSLRFISSYTRFTALFQGDALRVFFVVFRAERDLAIYTIPYIKTEPIL